jgi:hypothetical protein
MGALTARVRRLQLEARVDSFGKQSLRWGVHQVPEGVAGLHRLERVRMNDVRLSPEEKRAKSFVLWRPLVGTAIMSNYDGRA